LWGGGGKGPLIRVEKKKKGRNFFKYRRRKGAELASNTKPGKEKKKKKGKDIDRPS